MIKRNIIRIGGSQLTLAGHCWVALSLYHMQLERSALKLLSRSALLSPSLELFVASDTPRCRLTRTGIGGIMPVSLGASVSEPGQQQLSHTPSDPGWLRVNNNNSGDVSMTVSTFRRQKQLILSCTERFRR